MTFTEEELALLRLNPEFKEETHPAYVVSDSVDSLNLSAMQINEGKSPHTVEEELDDHFRKN